MDEIRLVALGPRDVNTLLAASALFDHPVRPEWAQRFLSAPGHHLVLAEHADGTPVGFVSGIEMTHPDKGTEMFLYELGVRADHRGRGIGERLVAALRDLAAARDCYGLWVITDEGNAAARHTYRRAGGGESSGQVVVVWDWREEPLPENPGD